MTDLSYEELNAHVEDVLEEIWSDNTKLQALESQAVDSTVFEQIAELGWFSLIAPESDGGMGLNPGMLAEVTRRFGERLVVGPWIEQMLLPGLLLSCLDSHKAASARELLTRALEGQVLVSLVDCASINIPHLPKQEITIDNDRLEGSVALVRYAADADALIIRVTSSAGDSILVVPAEREGIHIEPWESTDPGVGHAQVTFHNMAVSEDDILISAPDSTGAVELIESWMRVLLANEMTGLARYTHDLSVEYIKQRKQFGRPIGSFQAIQHLAAENLRRVVLLESYCDAVVDDSLSQTGSEFSDAAAALKGFVAEQARLVCEDALQMHGGIGFTYEYEFHWYYKRVLALEHWYGGASELAAIVGRNQLVG